jgi:adenylate kinase family enzyme
MNSDDSRKRFRRQESTREDDDCSSSKRRSPAPPLDEDEIDEIIELVIREERMRRGKEAGTENESVVKAESGSSAATDGREGGGVVVVDNSSSSSSKVTEIKSEMNVSGRGNGNDDDDDDDHDIDASVTENGMIDDNNYSSSSSSKVAEIKSEMNVSNYSDDDDDNDDTPITENKSELTVLPPEEEEEPEKKISNAEVIGKEKEGEGEGVVVDRKVLFLIGPPCAGKTTLCDILRDKFEDSYRVISVRSVIQRLANEGQSGAVDALTKGVMFDPTTVTKEIGKEIRASDDVRPVIIDGFPRVKENLTAWTEFVEGKNGIRYCGTILLNQDPKECERRAELRAREDDHTIKVRLTRWREETRPILLDELDNVGFILGKPDEFMEMADKLLK